MYLASGLALSLLLDLGMDEPWDLHILLNRSLRLELTWNGSDYSRRVNSSLTLLAHHLNVNFLDLAMKWLGLGNNCVQRLDQRLCGYLTQWWSFRSGITTL